MFIGPRCIVFSALVFVLFLTGCTIQTTATPSISPGVSLSGNVHGGRQAATGTHAQFLTASVTGYSTASTSPLTTGTDRSNASGGYVLIDAGGASNVTGEYTRVAGTT